MKASSFKEMNAMLINSTLIFMIKENPKGTHNYGNL